MSGQSGQSLSPEQIAALVEAAKNGELQDDAPAAATRRAPRLRTVNFARPTKFTSDQERRLGRSLESFCRTASTRLSAELRVPIEFEVIASSQLTWSSAVAALPSNSVCAVVDVNPIETRMVLGAELPFVLVALDALLGGAPGQPKDRRMTEIDWALSRRLFTTMLGQLSLIWKDVAGVELSLGTLEATSENAQVAPFSEATLSLTIEARIGRVSSTLSLLVPFLAIAPVAAAFSQRDGAGPGGTEEVDEEAIDAALRGVAITMRAEVSETHMSVEDVLALRPGDVITLDGKAADGVTVYADAVPVHRARPGRSGARRGVQIMGPIEESS